MQLYVENILKNTFPSPVWSNRGAPAHCTVGFCITIQKIWTQSYITNFDTSELYIEIGIITFFPIVRLRIHLSQKIAFPIKYLAELFTKTIYNMASWQYKYLGEKIYNQAKFWRSRGARICSFLISWQWLWHTFHTYHTHIFSLFFWLGLKIWFWKIWKNHLAINFVHLQDSLLLCASHRNALPWYSLISMHI